MNKKKILMVHNFYQIGGGEHTVFKNEVEMLREKGHEVIEYTRSNDELKNSKLKLLLLPFITIWSSKTYREVRKIIKEENIEVVHCHNTFPLISPSVYYAARTLKVPVVQTIHNFRFLCPCGIFYRDGKICEECLEQKSFKPSLKYKCYRNSKIQTLVVVMMLKVHRKLGTYKKINYIFLTEFNKKKFSELIDIDGTNVFVKPNFVKEHQLKEEKKFVFSGCLEENKGIKELLLKWSSMPDDYILHIYGSGTLENYVQKECHNSKNLVFYGFKSQEVIFDDLKSAKGMIFLGRLYEGFPMIIAESMAAGCPVILTKSGNQGELLEQSKGVATFDFNSDKSLKKAIDKCISDNMRLSQYARSFYKEIIEKDNNYVLLNDTYENIKIDRGIEYCQNNIFIFSGRLEENKGILSLLKMWNNLPKNYILHIYGTGTYKDYVERKANECSNIIFYGFQNQEIIFRDMLKSMAVLVTSEWYETFGMSIPESFSLGVPVIATDLGNPKWMIEESNGGITYKIDDFDSFFQAICNIIDNREVYSTNALLYYKEKLSSEFNYERLRDIYDKSKII